MSPRIQALDACLHAPPPPTSPPPCPSLPTDLFYLLLGAAGAVTAVGALATAARYGLKQMSDK